MPITSDHLFILAITALVTGVITLWVVLALIDNRLKLRHKLAQTEAREETRREIAAYVAEGSITPEDAAKLLAAGNSSLDSIKSTIRECINASSDACRTAGGAARRAAGRAETRSDAKQRVWGFRVGVCDDGIDINGREENSPA